MTKLSAMARGWGSMARQAQGFELDPFGGMPL